jgi:hypothetical protein
MLIVVILVIRVPIDLLQVDFFLAGVVTIQGKNLLVGIVIGNLFIAMLK